MSVATRGRKSMDAPTGQRLVMMQLDNPRYGRVASVPLRRRISPHKAGLLRAEHVRPQLLIDGHPGPN